MKRRMILAVAVAVLAISPAARADSTDTGTTSLDVTVGPEAQITVGTAHSVLSKVGTKFQSFTATTNFSYNIRTTEVGGSGAITVQITAFATGGPATSDLTYACTDASALGTACSSGTNVSTSTGTSVVSFGQGAHSSDSGNSASVTWTLVDKPSVVTGPYSSTATFTISAA